MKKVCDEFGKRIIFLAHPRTISRINEFDLMHIIESTPLLMLHEAVGYLDFIMLLSNARLVFTDSGGVQQESCIFKVPCVTLRENTEWTETIELGVNILAGTSPKRIIECAGRMLSFHGKWQNPFGEGDAAKQIVISILKEVGGLPVANEKKGK